MFNSSRRKIILAIMGSLILLFGVTLGVILTASFHEVRQKNADMLERFVEMYSLDPGREEKPGPVPDPEKREPPPDQKPDYQLSTFYSVAIAKDGSVLAVDNAGRDIYSSEELVRIADGILSGGKRSGRTGSLSYAVSERSGYTLVALMDNTVSEGGLRTLLRNVLTVGGAAIAVLFLLSLQLAKRIIRPLEENDRQQKRFVSDASHELKTPVAVIETNAEMLSREIGENEWLANIRYENERMGGLVKQLLDLSRAESAETPMEPVDFSRLVTGEALVFESLAFDQGKTLETDIAGGILLNGNRTQLAQLVSILLDNAVRHSTGTEIRLSLKRRPRTAVLTVSNEGEAIPKEKLDHLFDRFYQADEARNQDGQHYGLGLSIARAVAEKHGGHIEVSCQDGEIRFTAVLPA